MTAPHASPGPETDDLARAARRGEPDAVGAWFRAEHPAVWRLCFGLLADGAEADDLAQDAMVHLHDRLDAWDERRPYATWRNAVVANLCRDRRRRRAARRDAEQDAAAAAGLPDRLPAPDDRARAGEVRAALGAALASLAEREREAFVLRELEGSSTREAAAALGVTEGTVRSLCTLARRRLRTLLAERVPGLVPDAEGGPA